MFKYNWNFLDQLLLYYEFYGVDIKAIYIFIFVSCVTLETSLKCILLLASRDVHFDKRMICFLGDLL